MASASAVVVDVVVAGSGVGFGGNAAVISGSRPGQAAAVPAKRPAPRRSRVRSVVCLAEECDSAGHSASQLGNAGATPTRRGAILASAAGGIALAAAAAGAAQAGPAAVQAEPSSSVPAAYSFKVPLRIVALRGSLPPTWQSDFKATQGPGADVTVAAREQLSDIFNELTQAKEKKQKGKGKKSAAAADAVTLGDAWLPSAIQRGVIAPIANAQQSYWWRRTAGPTWTNLGLSIPMWLHVDQMGGDITDWSDLWRPQLAGRVAMYHSPREVMGIVLKSLGGYYNATDLDRAVGGGMRVVASRYHALNKQVRAYDSQYSLKALAAGDVWVAVGWSNDVLPFAQRTPQMRVVAPMSGTSLFADVWAVPTNMPPDIRGKDNPVPSPLLDQWFTFSLQPARSQALLTSKAGFSAATSEAQGVEFRYGRNKVVPVSAEVLRRSEFLQPLPERTKEQYKKVAALAKEI
eukprot:jgi/Chlat1/8998/Chrsp94S08337